jgi:hypothetical protein
MLFIHATSEKLSCLFTVMQAEGQTKRLTKTSRGCSLSGICALIQVIGSLVPFCGSVQQYTLDANPALIDPFAAGVNRLGECLGVWKSSLSPRPLRPNTRMSRIDTLKETKRGNGVLCGCGRPARVLAWADVVLQVLRPPPGIPPQASRCLSSLRKRVPKRVRALDL